MKVLINKDYFDWREDSRNADAVKWLDRFLVRVFKATDKESAPRVKKGIGSKLPRTVQEYEMGGRKYRVYAKYVVIDGETTFCAAAWHHKNVNKGQNSYVEAAEKLFENFDLAQWAAWQPSAEQLAEYSADDDMDADEADNAPCAEEAQPTVKKKKGKPVDENGMTPAERKALRKKQQQEAMQQARAEAQKRRKEQQTADATQAPQPAQPAVQPAVPAEVVKAPVHAPEQKPDTVETPAPVVDAAAKTPAPAAPAMPATDDITDDQVRVLGTRPDNTGIRDTAVTVNVDAENKAPIADDITDDQVRVLGTRPADITAPAPVPAEQPKPATTPVPEFTDYADVQYQLDAIAHQINIATIRIQATLFEISVENLKIKRLQLLRGQNRNPADGADAVPEFKDYAYLQYQLDIIALQIKIEELNIKKSEQKITLEELMLQKLKLLQKMKGMGK